MNDLQSDVKKIFINEISPMYQTRSKFWKVKYMYTRFWRSHLFQIDLKLYHTKKIEERMEQFASAMKID